MKTGELKIIWSIALVRYSRLAGSFDPRFGRNRPFGCGRLTAGRRACHHTGDGGGAGRDAHHIIPCLPAAMFIGFYKTVIRYRIRSSRCGHHASRLELTAVIEA